MAFRREKELGWTRRHDRSIPNQKVDSGKHGGSRSFERIGGSEAAAAGDLHRWANWLRRNEARQIRGALCGLAPDGSVLVCAIGALEELSNTRPVLFSMTRERRFLRRVVLLNDRLGWTFPQIATWLDRIADGRLSLDEALQIRCPSRLPTPGTV